LLSLPPPVGLAMHFVAMLAFSLPGVDLSYDFPLTVLSFVLPIGVTALAFLLVSDRANRPARLATSGAIMGAGIVAMHYTGMAAMRAPGLLH
jgi:NO-binding membrane sensor protein with MHYT domain